MKHFTRRWLAGAVALIGALGAPPATFAGPASGLNLDLGPAATDAPPSATLDHLTDAGSPVRLGFGVTPLRSQLGPAASALPGAHGSEDERPLDADSRGTAVSFDLRLAWPGAARVGPLEPYLTLGPALFVIEPDYAGRLLGTRVDPTLQLGAKLGAGVNWRVGRRTMLFGAYELTTTGQGGLVPGGGRAAEPGLNGYDFTYGLRVLY